MTNIANTCLLFKKITSEIYSLNFYCWHYIFLLYFTLSDLGVLKISKPHLARKKKGKPHITSFVNNVWQDFAHAIKL